MKYLIDKYVDIVFANEEEAKAFTGKEPEQALDMISSMCEIAIVKIGAEGSLVKRANEREAVGAIKAKPIDTTGAGDNYAAGFLYGLINNWDLRRCASWLYISRKCYRSHWCYYGRKRWNKIKEEISQLKIIKN